MTWRTSAILLCLASVLVVGATVALASFVPSWLESQYATSSSIPRPVIKKDLAKESAALPRPTEEQIASAAAAQLTRMSPPPPLSRPPESAAAPMLPPPVVQVPLFPGTLIGTIEDADPALSFAILRWPDNRVQLVACGEPLNEQPESPKVESIGAGTVTLKRGEQSQTLQVPSP